MDWTHYRFRTLWSLPVRPAAVYAALERPEDYPRWWPQVRTVTRLDDSSGVLAIRSVLPYAMTFTARQTRRDPATGILEAALSGDIEGWARWTVSAGGPGALARYDQVVDVTKPLLRKLAVPGRPLFLANHRLMMDAGRRGLLRHLEAV
ncbi:SRPBCC family protein [Streptomyces sp. TG1A-8]|uniref:SRPBCC family protein n=1 Tax=Streptomyces sp. TG1A-8 TaxID=3051385 RepID=UPI00265C489E|nr:SRPBCC family protein [Streptomyces sp. TG1A-8]MDO0928591.1 SRPBCC family protein [Streptomyces sp. TG1A-8]